MSGNTHINHKLNGNLVTLSSNNNKHHQNEDQSQVQNTPELLNSATNSTNPSYSQLQTVATIHHQNLSNNHHKVLSQQNANLSQIQRNPHQQIRNINTSGIASQHTVIPPRYQPPPQPPGGILKHLPTGKSCYNPTDLTVPHFNIKYPPDIPKLSSVYIPDSDKVQHSNQSRISQRQPVHRQSTGGGQLKNLDENHIRNQTEMLKFVRKSDQDHNGSNIPVNSTSGRLTTEQNRHLQSLILELRALKESNQRLSDDNQELRDLCCFLDDDRQKGRKLAREWQRFGRYTASVMRQEVSAYQNKLRQLDDKQQELIRDNLELKELCLYLDEERAHVAAINLCSNCCSSARPTLRDDGDGSSYSTNAEETMSTIRNYDRQLPELNLRSTLSDQTIQYVRSLEQRVQQLEEERMSGTDNVEQEISDPISGRPEAVIRALQVLEVREQLERDKICNMTESQIEQMDEGEKALVREMCNVVWRKLEESPNGPNME